MTEPARLVLFFTNSGVVLLVKRLDEGYNILAQDLLLTISSRKIFFEEGWTCVRACSLSPELSLWQSCAQPTGM